MHIQIHQGKQVTVTLCNCAGKTAFGEAVYSTSFVEFMLVHWCCHVARGLLVLQAQLEMLALRT
jgi:hypothetical protein